MNITEKERFPRVLIISSLTLSSGPGVIAGQYYEALKKKGVEVDLMLKFPDTRRPEALYVVREGYDNNFFVRLRRRLQRMIDGVKRINPTNVFFYTKEIYPPVPPSKVLSAIKKEYDLVVIVFWQVLLSFETIQKIYDRLHCQIQFLGVDYSQMSGGCHFIGACERYKIGCGKCPGIYSNKENDFTAWNVKYRKKVYDNVRPIVFGNQYMHEFYKESYLLKDANTELNKGIIIDTDVFRPLCKEELQKKYDIPQEIKYIVLFGCQSLSNENKGMSYLIDALAKLYELLGHESGQVLVMAVGNDFSKIRNQISFPTRELGFVALDDLPGIYSMATFFVCSSINDAGPMMVNQSLCCGTPVVGFDMGAVKQSVKDKGTGICVPLKDTDALAKGMLQMIRMDKNDYLSMSKRARNLSLEYFSFDAQADMIINTYRKYIR